jgi:hypothetical protein
MRRACSEQALIDQGWGKFLTWVNCNRQRSVSRHQCESFKQDRLARTTDLIYLSAQTM